jgi:hypothetical protein
MEFGRTNDMTGLDVSSVAALLREFAQRSALRGDNPFRTKAHARAADRHLPDSAQALSMGVELTARLTDAAHFGVTLLLATGSEAHLAGLRAIAASQSMSLDDDGSLRPPAKTASIERLACSRYPRSCAKAVMRLLGPLPETYPSLLPITISPGSSTRIPIAPTDSIRLRRWLRPR